MREVCVTLFPVCPRTDSSCKQEAAAALPGRERCMRVCVATQKPNPGVAQKPSTGIILKMKGKQKKARFSQIPQLFFSFCFGKLGLSSKNSISCTEIVAQSGNVCRLGAIYLFGCMAVGWTQD